MTTGGCRSGDREQTVRSLRRIRPVVPGVPALSTTPKVPQAAGPLPDARRQSVVLGAVAADDEHRGWPPDRGRTLGPFQPPFTDEVMGGLRRVAPATGFLAAGFGADARGQAPANSPDVTVLPPVTVTAPGPG